MNAAKYLHVPELGAPGDAEDSVGAGVKSGDGDLSGAGVSSKPGEGPALVGISV